MSTGGVSGLLWNARTLAVPPPLAEAGAAKARTRVAVRIAPTRTRSLPYDDLLQRGTGAHPVLRADPVTGCGELRGLCGYPRSCGRMSGRQGRSSAGRRQAQPRPTAGGCPLSRPRRPRPPHLPAPPALTLDGRPAPSGARRTTALPGQRLPVAAEFAGGGPSSGRVAAHRTEAAPSVTGRAPMASAPGHGRSGRGTRRSPGSACQPARQPGCW